ncbi:MAG: SUMF1/EgtB/PvdO family nonheme iron enzyme, partial [Anaerolineales bacterium]|nr:SUMF1/EgtB/PvdO family nonheme iron enzyme [Anaerolineales bacterium]
VWEWCHSLYKPYPYKADDGREDEKADDAHVLRGGSFIYNGWLARCACRIILNAYINGRLGVNGGIRVVASSVLF